MHIITVTEYPSMPNRFIINFKDEGDRKATYDSDRTGIQAAAASAIDLAFSVSKYVIFGSDKVLNCIPQSLRSRT